MDNYNIHPLVNYNFQNTNLKPKNLFEVVVVIYH